MKEIATIAFYDNNTLDEGVAIIRCNSNQIALAFSLKLDGDIEVIMSREDAKKIFNSLKLALDYN